MTGKHDDQSPFGAQNRQKQVYISGLSGTEPIVPFDYEKLKAAAKEKMTPEAFGYIVGGAGTDSTIQNNRTSFGKWRILPRMLRDVSQRDTSIELFGKKISSPFLTAPIGVLEMCHKEADLAVGRAAAAAGVPMIFSNQASLPMEEVAGAMGDSPRWFQLYWSKNNDLVASLVRRAEACGCSAIVITLDTTLLGWRIQDLDFSFLPFMHGKGIAQYVSDPVFQQMLDEPEDLNAPKLQPKMNLETIANVMGLMKKYPDPFFQNLSSKRPLKAVATFTSTYSRPSLTWKDLPFLRQHTKLPILLKGILHPDDAKKAVEEGIDGIIVSNHGGRQVDGSVSSIEQLPKIVDAVGGKIPVLMDSGIRGGADIFKALALGAKAVCLGRPYAFGLAVAGETGVLEVLKNTMADFELTMALAGCKSVSEINRDCLTENR